MLPDAVPAALENGQSTDTFSASAVEGVKMLTAASQHKRCLPPVFIPQ